LCDESITTIKKREKQLIDGITKHSQKLQNEIEVERKTDKQTFCDLKRQADQAEQTIILHQDEIMVKYLISEGIGFKLKSDIIFLDFVAVVNIVLPWIDFKAAMISSWWSIIVCSAWSACLFKSQNVFLTVFLSNSISFCSF
jgi:hypothetical protein